MSGSNSIVGGSGSGAPRYGVETSSRSRASGPVTAPGGDGSAAPAETVAALASFESASTSFAALLVGSLGRQATASPRDGATAPRLEQTRANTGRSELTARRSSHRADAAPDGTAPAVGAERGLPARSPVTEPRAPGNSKPFVQRGERSSRAAETGEPRLDECGPACDRHARDIAPRDATATASDDTEPRLDSDAPTTGITPNDPSATAEERDGDAIEDGHDVTTNAAIVAPTAPAPVAVALSSNSAEDALGPLQGLAGGASAANGTLPADSLAGLAAAHPLEPGATASDEATATGETAISNGATAPGHAVGETPGVDPTVAEVAPFPFAPRLDAATEDQSSVANGLRSGETSITQPNGIVAAKGAPPSVAPPDHILAATASREEVALGEVTESASATLNSATVSNALNATAVTEAAGVTSATANAQVAPIVDASSATTENGSEQAAVPTVAVAATTSSGSLSADTGESTAGDPQGEPSHSPGPRGASPIANGVTTGSVAAPVSPVLATTAAAETVAASSRDEVGLAPKFDSIPAGLAAGLEKKLDLIGRTSGSPLAAPRGDSEPPVADPASVVRQASAGIAKARGEGSEMRMRLDPPELGSLLVRVGIRDGAVSVRVETETASAQRMLSDHLPQLRESLASQGLQVHNIEVVPQSERGAPGQGFPQQERGGRHDSGGENSRDGQPPPRDQRGSPGAPRDLAAAPGPRRRPRPNTLDTKV